MRNGPYILVIAPDEYPGKRYRGRYAYEHHLVWWQNTGQLVPPGFDLHHKDEVKTNNVFQNLELKTHGGHVADHNRSKPLKPGPVHASTVYRRVKKLLAGLITGNRRHC
jgi:hypothetical protein